MARAQGKTIRYNIDNTNGVPTESETDMPNSTTFEDIGDNAQAHAAEPIMERQSDVHGTVRVYPPSAEPKEWANHSWLLTTEKNAADGSLRGISERIKAKFVQECFDRPHFIHDYHRFGNPDPEIVVKEEKKWNIEVPDRKVVHKDFTFDD